jgi:hypothetical protein
VNSELISEDDVDESNISGLTCGPRREDKQTSIKDRCKFLVYVYLLLYMKFDRYRKRISEGLWLFKFDLWDLQSSEIAFKDRIMSRQKILRNIIRTILVDYRFGYIFRLVT